MFFKKNKTSFDAKKPNQIKNATNIICPNCNNEQLEPKMALSTNCKVCSTYFKIVKGKAVPPTDNGSYSPPETKISVEDTVIKQEASLDKTIQSQPAAKEIAPHSPIPINVEPLKPLPMTAEVPEPIKMPSPNPKPIRKEASLITASSELLPEEPKATPPISTPPISTPPIETKSVPPVVIEEEDEISNNTPPPSSTIPSAEPIQESAPEQAPKRYVPTPSKSDESESATGLFGKGKAKSVIKQRDVSCLDCDRVHQAPMGASSTNCPQCGTYITLKDFDIRGPSNQRIQTRGNVVIHKKASVTGINIHCHNLTITGQFTGGVNCSGDFILDSHGKLMGEVKCKRLIIEKKADVEFAGHVYAEEVIIDGSAIGNFTCSGKLQLKKKATLTGDISVKTMTMEEGAKHNGRMSIGQ